MRKTTYELVEVKFIDMFHFQMQEGKFKVVQEVPNEKGDTFLYANVSTFDSKTYEESDLRIYSASFESVEDASDVELHELYENTGLREQLKSEILKRIR